MCCPFDWLLCVFTLHVSRRPLTRGGGRPPSRMQMSAAAAAATTASTTGSGLDGTAPRTPATTAETFGSSTGPLTLPPRTYASVASPHHYHNHHHLSQSLGHPNQSQSRAQNHRSSIPAPPSPSSPSRSHPNTQQEQHHTAHSSTHASNPPIQQPSRLPQANTHHDYAAQTQQCQQEGPDILTVEDFVDRLPSDDDEGSDVKGVRILVGRCERRKEPCSLVLRPTLACPRATLCWHTSPVIV
eukprot:1146759-Pelagomonas_calceolata.AAC.1